MDPVELFENINIAEVCRACFETCKHYKFLIDEAESIENRTLGDVFFDVVKIEMCQNSETTPTRICLACSYDLVNAYNFIQKSKKNNERLIQLLKHPNIKQSDCLTEFEIDIPHDQNISDTFQIKIEKETLHDYNDSMLMEYNNSSINSFASDGSDYEPLENKKVKIPKLQCTHCYRIFKNQHLYESHMGTHTEGDVKKKEESEDGCKLDCYECDYSCHSDLEMEKHQKSEHTTSCFAVVEEHPGPSFQKKIEKKSLKITQPRQFERLISLLQKQPELAGVKGMPSSLTKNVQKEQWEKIAVELNNCGPPTRTSKEWQRVWIHYKANLKRKWDKKSRTGLPKEFSLNEREESVVGLVELKKSSNSTVKTTGLNHPQPPPVFQSQSDKVKNIPPKEFKLKDATAISKPLETKPQTKIQFQAIEEERINYLKTQTENQKAILETLRKMERLMTKNFDLNKQMVELKKKKSLQASELHTLKVEVKKRKIAWLDNQLLNTH